MSRYRKVDQRMWADAKFLSLGDRAKLLWVYLLTGTSTTSLPGVIVAGRAQIAEHLGWSPEVFAARSPTAMSVSVSFIARNFSGP